MYERHGQPLLSRRLFVRRVVRSLAAGALIITVSLSVGMLGYHWLENMRWIDAFANAAMILSGMGPLEPLKTDGGKIEALPHDRAGYFDLTTDEAADVRKAMVNALEGLDIDPRAYETLYELNRVGHEENSVLSVLENVANHDREHAAQIRAIIEVKAATGLSTERGDLIN